MALPIRRDQDSGELDLHRRNEDARPRRDDADGQTLTIETDKICGVDGNPMRTREFGAGA